MNKVAHYLQQHLGGEILTSSDVLDYFSTDESILQLRPQLVVYPRSESDIRKTTRFTWQLAEKGRVVPVTARGMGTDQTGASLGAGIIVALPAHMNRVIEFDSKTGVISVEAGMSLDKLQQVLHTHGRFLPPISSVNKYATVGGAIGNNDTGRHSYKYGPMHEFVRSLRVVLANGELIETGRLSKRELNKKLGLASFEGEIYRSLDKLIEESQATVEDTSRVTDITSAGYNISAVKHKDGSFDLTPLFLGSQGTLGVVTEVTFETAPHNPVTDYMVVGFADRSQGWRAVAEINALKEGPSSVDFIDMSLINMLQHVNPGVLKPLEGGVPAMLLFIDIDNDSTRGTKKVRKKITKLLDAYESEIVTPKDEEKHKWERLRDGASTFLTHNDNKKQAVPVLDDAYVPIDRMNEFFNEVHGLLQAAALPDYAAWGQAGNGMVHIAPLLDITSVGDRQKLFKVMNAFYGYVCKIGGSIAGEYAEGRMRGIFADKQFSPQALEMFMHLKHVFDPNNTLNPGVKVGAKFEDIKTMIRDNYRLDHQYNHLPRS